MPQALLFLPLFLSLGVSAVPTVSPGPVADDRAVARALLAQLTELIPPRALTGRGVSCQALRPSALPGFAQLPVPARSLARAAMVLALSAAACGPQAEAEILGLSWEMGPTEATALLRGLARLRGPRDPLSPLPLLLLSLVRSGGSAPALPCAPTAHPTAPLVRAQGVWMSPGSRAPARLPPCTRTRRHRREEEEEDNVCNPPGEQEAHGVLEWVPGVSTFYNLGTSIYYAFQGCRAQASTRALEFAEDLGYTGLAALTAGISGPVALGLQLGLKPGLKAGVRALVHYFTSDGDPPPAPTAHSGPVLII
ncbi:apolipoprotein F [Calypte anna]|uniref:apolipoprotein F n=1 Tax=Calypte anna TaxID=9244 RepID=UPI0011C4200D|nr:apolipoprotein F [Calypte anna]